MTRYIANTDIFAAAGVRAFHAGDEVPASAVENLNCRDKVTAERPKPASKDAKNTPATES